MSDVQGGEVARRKLERRLTVQGLAREGRSARGCAGVAGPTALAELSDGADL